jgi:hypothetical protein
MKKLALILVVLFTVLFLFNTVFAQEKGYRAFGIGVNVIDYMSGAGSTIYLPINLGPSFRLEPMLGISNYAEDNDDDSEYSDTDFTIGLGIYPTIRKGDAVIYVGGRLGMIISSSEYTNSFDNTTKYSDFTFGIGPALGGEYYFSPHFSLGGEMAIMYHATTDKTEYENGNDIEDTSAGFETQSLVFVRFYF